MKLIPLTCKNCGAHLDINIEKLQAFCPYCGEKLLIEMEQLGEIVSEIEQTKRVITKEQEYTKRVIAEQDQKNKSDRREKLFVLFLILLPILLVPIGCVLYWLCGVLFL